MTTTTTVERLPIAPTGRHAGHWASISPAQAAEITRRDVVGDGVCLPMVRFCDQAVVPVIRWNRPVLRARLDGNLGPILDRFVLSTRLSNGLDHLVPAALQMLAFITVTPLTTARSGLAAVSGYSPAIAAVPRPPGADSWEALSCDFYGFTVAEVDASGARIVVPGLGRPKHPRGGVPHQRRLMEEQLFDVALRANVTPGLA